MIAGMVPCRTIGMNRVGSSIQTGPRLSSAWHANSAGVAIFSTPGTSMAKGSCAPGIPSKSLTCQTDAFGMKRERSSNLENLGDQPNATARSPLVWNPIASSNRSHHRRVQLVTDVGIGNVAMGFFDSISIKSTPKPPKTITKLPESLRIAVLRRSSLRKCNGVALVVRGCQDCLARRTLFCRNPSE